MLQPFAHLRMNGWARVSAFTLAALVLTAVAQEIPKSSLFDSGRLLSDLRILSSDEMQGRRTGTPGGDRARAFIVDRFKESGLSPVGASFEHDFQLGFRGNTAAGRGVNVIGLIKGRRQPNRYIVVSAHYDHLGVRNGQVFNGADDNASGTASLFTLAAHFAANQPENSLLFVAFDAEEIGRLGSVAFVRNPPVERERLLLNINIDMIGREPANRLFVVGTAREPALRPIIEALIPKVPVRLLVGHEDPRQPEDWTQDSDHYSFMQAGIPALYFGVEDYDQHHKSTDDYETMSYGFYVRSVETLVLAIEQFDANLDGVAAARKTTR